MKLMRLFVLSALFGVGVGMVAPEFAAAQVRRPPLPDRPREVVPGPLDAPPGPPGIAPGPPGYVPGPGPRPPGVVPRPPVEPRPRVVAPPPPGPARRGPVVTHRNLPIKIAPRDVIVRPPRGVVRPFIAPELFLPPIVFGGVVVDLRNDRRPGRDRGYSRDSLVWQDSETLYREDDWTDFTLDCNARGSKLWFEVLEGRVEADWAEVVFENGEVQVVEFPKRSLGRGIYELLSFRESRRVDTVRMVAKTTSRQARLTLWMER